MNRLAYIENLLDSDNLTEARRAELETEADDLAGRITRSQDKEKLLAVEKQKRVEEIKAMYAAGNVSAIDLFGIPEFGDDYEVTQEGGFHVVYSKVARDDQSDRHLCSSAEEANRKFRKLVWDRLYTKYVRAGEVGQLDELAV